jgi:integrase
MGVFLFLSKDSSGIYQLYYTNVKGKRSKVSTRAKTKDEALRFLQHFDTEQQRRKNCRLKDFIPEFIEYVKANYHYRTFLIYRITLRRFTELVPDNISLSQITAKHWDQYKTMRLKTVSPVTLNIELRALKSMFHTAMRWKEIDENPFTDCSNCFVEEKNPEYITEEDFEKLLLLIEEVWLKEIVIFTVLTGLRRGEVTNLKWDQVNLQNKTITILSSATFKTKGGKKRTIALSESAILILNKKVDERSCEYVFSLNGKQIYAEWVSKKFVKYVRMAGIKGKIGFHVLRHTFSSWLVMKGISIYSVSKLLGHSSVVTTQGYYAHLQPAELHDQVNKLSIRLN